MILLFLYFLMIFDLCYVIFCILCDIMKIRVKIIIEVIQFLIFKMFINYL